MRHSIEYQIKKVTKIVRQSQKAPTFRIPKWNSTSWVKLQSPLRIDVKQNRSVEAPLPM